ncbi:heterokaryon incompatibility protein-domain-containing protein [Epithele typhae]|uniref:heterokaryon incompatibility protein-domain-containing protein n=1 Tax=Epithele typhae TaxID=378194 RepID=UPI0020080884|nr:heterokaryon incompatibility protein-domain-containing protein [Epithele typhae]KAH9918562.1 heterokaryon incompatibility protein-domain-containing protein [Epithele typhae]
MWLLDTARANLEFFPRSYDIPGGYAILSHTWSAVEDGGEDSFQFHTVPSSPPWFNPRDRLSPKVRAFLERAEKAGYRYAWVDTCCIDKTSSAELTEAINSMFEYYSCSAVCYVYLSGVSSEHFDPAHDGHLDFQGQLRQWCRWCRRGWTLQELIASPVILFFSEEWTVIGSKHELAEILEESTGVPATVLRFEKPITDMSVAARMSWASHRTTTRPEDRAYCLFGLFGINMPTLYGEGGDNAFYRLLEEIMKTTRDTTIFLVGDSLVYRSWNEILERYSELREGSYSCYLFPSSPLEYVKHLCNNLSFKINPLYDYHDRKNEVRSLYVAAVLVDIVLPGYATNTLGPSLPYFQHISRWVDSHWACHGSSQYHSGPGCPAR